MIKVKSNHKIIHNLEMLKVTANEGVVVRRARAAAFKSLAVRLI